MYKIKLINKDSICPKRATDGAAGYDLYSSIDCVIPPKSSFNVNTGVAISIPKDIAALVYIRSGLAFKYGLDLVNSVGVIDSDYRGEIIVGIYNNSSEKFEIKKGDRIAQIVFTKIETPTLQICDDLEDTNRGKGGFGSTGIN